jgi:hypothetical protein
MWIFVPLLTCPSFDAVNLLDERAGEKIIEYNTFNETVHTTYFEEIFVLPVVMVCDISFSSMCFFRSWDLDCIFCRPLSLSADPGAGNVKHVLFPT